MLEKFLVLLERFVVAHELIAANSAKQVVHAAAPREVDGLTAEVKEPVKEKVVKAEATKEIPVEGEDVVDTKPEEEVDYQSLRDQIQAIDDAINEGPSDAACDDSDELLEEFTGKKMKIAAIKDEDLAEYLERLTAIKNKYFEEE